MVFFVSFFTKKKSIYIPTQVATQEILWPLAREGDCLHHSSFGDCKGTRGFPSKRIEDESRAEAMGGMR